MTAPDTSAVRACAERNSRVDTLLELVRYYGRARVHEASSYERGDQPSVSDARQAMSEALGGIESAYRAALASTEPARGELAAELDREALGRIVREVWPPPTVGERRRTSWERLPTHIRQSYCAIGEAVARAVLASTEPARGRGALLDDAALASAEILAGRLLRGGLLVPATETEEHLARAVVSLRAQLDAHEAEGSRRASAGGEHA